jgi:hypothetical protein
LSLRLFLPITPLNNIKADIKQFFYKIIIENILAFARIAKSPLKPGQK